MHPNATLWLLVNAHYGMHQVHIMHGIDLLWPDIINNITTILFLQNLFLSGTVAVIRNPPFVDLVAYNGWDWCPTGGLHGWPKLEGICMRSEVLRSLFLKISI